MLKQLIFLSIAVAVYGSPFHGRIMGGENTDILDNPWQVSIEFNKVHFCGGMILNENYILTAGHCTNWYLEENFQIVVNTTQVAPRIAARYNVSKFHHNEDHDVVTHDKDITIIELATPLELGPGVQPIKLPEEGAEHLPVGTPVTITGWGSGRFLQIVEVNVVSNEECAVDYKMYGHLKITENMLCAGVPEGGKDACGADAGGPLVSNGTVYGIFSWGYDDLSLFEDQCGTAGFPSVYVDVISLRSFITEITGL